MWRATTGIGDSVQLSIKAGTGTPGAILTCATNPKVTAGAGNVTFTGCSVDKVGIGYVLRATTGAAAVDTNAFNISLGAPNKLVFQTYPAPTTPTLLTPQPSVAVADAGGNVITSDNSTVVTISINANAGTFSCTGGLSKTVTAGIAPFAGCTQTSTGNYTLTAISSPALVPGHRADLHGVLGCGDQARALLGNGPCVPEHASFPDRRWHRVQHPADDPDPGRGR